MSFYTGTVACPGSTGNFTMTSLGFTPVGCAFYATGKASGSTSTARWSRGGADGTRQSCKATIHGSATGSKNYSDKCLVILSTPGGVVDEVVQASFVSFGSGQCTINFSETDSEYEFTAEFWS